MTRTRVTDLDYISVQVKLFADDSWGTWGHTHSTLDAAIAACESARLSHAVSATRIVEHYSRRNIMTLTEAVVIQEGRDALKPQERTDARTET